MHVLRACIGRGLADHGPPGNKQSRLETGLLFEGSGGKRTACMT